MEIPVCVPCVITTLAYTKTRKSMHALQAKITMAAVFRLWDGGFFFQLLPIKRGQAWNKCAPHFY